ncbi:hypothetical protein GPALN_012330 [Globodera pallida]|nr:hypothetical protein GPALN_012330 [Globodera pallida]
MSDNDEADAVAAVRALRRQVVRGNLLLTQQNEILTQQNRSLTGKVSDQRVVIIQILTWIERLEAYAQNSRNGFRVQFSPLATQVLHAMGRWMDHLDRNNNTAASARSSTSINSVGGGDPNSVKNGASPNTSTTACCTYPFSTVQRISEECVEMEQIQFNNFEEQVEEHLEDLVRF